MDHRQRTILASGCVVLLFVVVQLGALALVEPFQQEGHQFVEDTEDPSLSIFYILAIFVMTAIMLAAFKYGGASVIRLVIIFAGAYIAYFVFQVLVQPSPMVTIGGSPLDLVAAGLAFVLAVGLYFHPEWYVIDAAGIIMGIGAAGLFGINLNVLPVIVLLVALAVYDAISVYRTEHMLTLASGAMDIRVPVVFIVPLTLSYSFIEDGGPMTLEEDGPVEDGTETPEAEVTPDGNSAADVDLAADADADREIDAERLRELGPDGVENLSEAELVSISDEAYEGVDEDIQASIREAMPERDALFIGLGDAVMPTILVASAAFFLGGPQVSLLGISANLPALLAMGGTLVGLSVLLFMVTKGRAHAGLPLLNGGAIAGYLIGALLSGISLLEALGIEGIL